MLEKSCMVVLKHTVFKKPLIAIIKDNLTLIISHNFIKCIEMYIKMIAIPYLFAKQ